MLRHRRKQRPFLLQIAATHRSVRHNIDLTPPFHSKLFLQVLRTLLRGKGSQPQDYGQAI